MHGAVLVKQGTMPDVHGTVSVTQGTMSTDHGECARVHGTVSVYYGTAFLRKWHHDSLTRHRVRCTRYQDSVKWYVTVWAPELSTQSTESNKRIGKRSLGRGVAHCGMQTHILVQAFV